MSEDIPTYRMWADLVMNFSEETVILFGDRVWQTTLLIIVWGLFIFVLVSLIDLYVQNQFIQEFFIFVEHLALFPVMWLLIALLITIFHDVDRAKELLCGEDV